MQGTATDFRQSRENPLERSSQTAILLLYCTDRPGLVRVVADFIFRHGGNILNLNQHQDNHSGLFFMRVEWSLMGFSLNEQQFKQAFSTLAGNEDFRWRVAFGNTKPSVAVFVSRYQHCLLDLLYRHRIGELDCHIALVVSNHEDARPLVEFYGLPFFHTPVTRETKMAAETSQLQLLQRYGVDLVVLARYMQVLSPDFVSRYPDRIINVHHSFLPAFTGAKPYHAAHERGVKLIGATSHYVNDDLDEGAIIEQDVVRVSHRDDPEVLIEKGRVLERVVLSRAVRWHLQQRVLCYGNRTVVFE